MRAKLVSRFASRRGADVREAAPPEPPPPLGDKEVRADLRMMRRAGEALGIDNPFFRPHAAIAGATTIIGNREYDNFVSYNYIGLNGDPRVSEAAKLAIDRYGTSVSASRIVSGERPVHRDLELALADAHGTEDALALVSGHATNVTVIGHLVDRNDLILHDALSHNSIVQGALLSGARRISFPHNDLGELDRLLGEARSSVTRALIVIEGHYSMDGDIPDLGRVLAIARKHRASVMVDEAHSLGVLGANGLGIAEHCGIDPKRVDLWMGTLSKSLSSCGGYVAGSAALIDYLRCSAPGFVYSVGMPAPVAAAALASLRILRAEPQRVARLAHNATFFLERAREAGLDTGLSIGAAIVPIMTGSSIRAARAADHLFRAGINVQPIMYPAVQERAARLRFFISSLHTEAQLANAALQTADALSKAGSEKVSVLELAKMLGAGQE
jgi:8-amino-7-oxononanoate synthase